MNRYFQDQIGNSLIVDSPPQRIVSLVPSLTELLFDLDLEDEMIGITRFCVHPIEKCHKKIKIGGTKDFDIDEIIQLKPDFILASKEENTKEGIEKLSAHFPVYVSDIQNLEHSFRLMKDLGVITGKEQKAEPLITGIKDSFLRLDTIQEKVSVAYFIWRKPYMAVGGETFIHHLLDRMGVINAFDEKQRYPQVSAGELSELKPDFIFLSSEPYPFKEKHINEFQAICPDSRIVLVDGEYFSWYGSRLLKSVDYLNGLIKELKKGKKI